MAELQGAKVSIADGVTGQTIEYEMVRVGTMVQYREAVKAVEALTSRANKEEATVEELRKRTIAAEAAAGVLRGDAEVAASKIAGLKDTAQALAAKVQASDANALDADRAHAERADVADTLRIERDAARGDLGSEQERCNQAERSLAELRVALDNSEACLAKAQAKLEAERERQHSTAVQRKEVRVECPGVSL